MAIHLRTPEARPRCPRRPTEILWIVIAGLTSACTASPLREGGTGSVDEYQGVRIVEVLSNAVGGPRGAFVEIRNDGESAVSLGGWGLRFGANGAPVALAPRQVQSSVEAARNVDPTLVQPHGLALIVDRAMTDDAIARAACEKGIGTTETALPPAQNKKQRDNLVTTLLLQQARHCIPVFTIDDADGLGARLEGSSDLSLMQGGERRDRAQAPWAQAPAGVSLERRGLEPGQFAASPIGSTPGTRNFFGSDPHQLASAGGRAPITVRHASPWRWGELARSLRREASAKRAQAETAAPADAGRLRAEADELIGRVNSMQCEEHERAPDYNACKAARAQHLPHNPLVSDFDELVGEATESVVGSFYQINEHEVVEALVQAAARVPATCANPLEQDALGPCVQLTTDASFATDPHYTPGFERFAQARIPLRFDYGENNQNRAPLSHNKFLVVDGEWIWTGSFNPIEDEPALIHADNALILHSTGLAAIHQQEFETLLGGQFGILKRDEGVGGGEAWVDGAQVEVRFSPGLTADQLARRGAALRAGEDACEVSIPATGAYVIEDRYRSLDPCGGPLDLLSAEVARAQSSIYFGFFSFALNSVKDVIVERMTAGGVEVKGVGDQTTATRGALTQMAEAGADVRFTPNSDPDCAITPTRFCPTNLDKVWFHHKFIIIDYGTDHPVVITGSHNMSDSAEDVNDETLVVVRDRAVAEAYYRMFRESFDHPQALGGRRQTDDLPALAITEVRGSAAPDGPQFVEITNLGEEEASLDGLEIWNRSTSVELDGNALSLEPGARAVFVVGDDASLGIPDDALVIVTSADDVPFIGPATALVLRTGDGRWVATYDPYTSDQNLPPGVSASAPGAAVEWLGFDARTVAALTLELLGQKNEDAAADRFNWSVWQPRGTYSEWRDEHEVTPNGLVLWQSVASSWTPAADPAGTPGKGALAPNSN